MKRNDRTKARGASAPRPSFTDPTIVKEIEALRRLDVPALIERYGEVWGKEPRIRNREGLWKRIAWKIQEQRLGGLSAMASKRLEELIADIRLPLGEDRRTVRGALRKAPRIGQPGVGAVLTRTWNGQTIEVKVIDGGFEYEGVVYRSLSAVAKAITGAHWNGKLFFGIVGRRKA